MNVLIIPCGDTGVTAKAASMLSDMLGGAKIADCKSKQQLSGYDAYVVGVSIRYAKFHKSFFRVIKRLNKLDNRKLFVYVSGAEVERKDYYVKLMRNIAPDAVDIRYVWGELDAEGKRFFKRFVIQSFIDGRRKDGLPKPRLLDKELRAISEGVLALAKPNK